MNNTPDPIRDILDKLWKDAWGKLGAYNFDGTGEDTLTKDQAEQAINAYILGEVMELIGEDDVQKPDDDEYDYPYCTTCDMCFFDGDKSNGCECTSRNRVRQELRNKANKKWGKL